MFRFALLSKYAARLNSPNIHHPPPPPPSNVSPRFHKLNVVQFLVKKGLPFDLPEDQDFQTMVIVQEGIKGPAKLTADGVKHVVVEMYDATKEKTSTFLREAAQGAHLPVLHLNLDLWPCKFSKRKYLGVRVFTVHNWELRAVNLAVSKATKQKEREFLPSV